MTDETTTTNNEESNRKVITLESLKDKEVFTFAEACVFMDLGRRVVETAIESGELAASKFGGAAGARITRRECLRFIETPRGFVHQRRGIVASQAPAATPSTTVPPAPEPTTTPETKPAEAPTTKPATAPVTKGGAR